MSRRILVSSPPRGCPEAPQAPGPLPGPSLLGCGRGNTTQILAVAHPSGAADGTAQKEWRASWLRTTTAPGTTRSHTDSSRGRRHGGPAPAPRCRPPAAGRSCARTGSTGPVTAPGRAGRRSARGGRAVLRRGGRGPAAGVQVHRDVVGPQQRGGDDQRGQPGAGEPAPPSHPTAARAAPRSLSTLTSRQAGHRVLLVHGVWVGGAATARVAAARAAERRESGRSGGKRSHRDARRTA